MVSVIGRQETDRAAERTRTKEAVEVFILGVGESWEEDDWWILKMRVISKCLFWTYESIE